MEVSLSTLIGSSSSLHSEACNALGGSDGIIHSRISLAVACLRAATNILLSACEAYQRRGRSVGYVGYSNREQLCSPTGNCSKTHGRSGSSTRRTRTTDPHYDLCGIRDPVYNNLHGFCRALYQHTGALCVTHNSDCSARYLPL